MTIGVISDTHGFLHPEVAQHFTGVDRIMHAGDVGTVEVLDDLENIAPVMGVYGNVDGREVRLRLPEHQRIELEGLRIWMTHIGGRPGRYDRAVRNQIGRDTPDIFICGHSHILQVARDADVGGMLFINPGAAGREGLHQVKTCLRLEIVDGDVRKAEVIHLDEGSRPNFPSHA